MAQTAEQKREGAVALEGADDFAALLQKEFRPVNETRQRNIERAVQTLAQQALELSGAQVIGEDVFATVDSIKAALDRSLTQQINQIIHHPDFQQLESAWRGLQYLVSNTSTGKDLKIRVMNVAKDEIRKMLREYKDVAWDQSPLFKKVYEAEFGQLGGQPYGMFVCDYYFGHSSTDISIMKGLSKIGAAAHAPFVAGTSPSILEMQSWQELSNPRDIAKQFEADEYREWRSFRESTDSRYLALTLPRFLGRNLYGSQGEPVEEFAFEEDTGGGLHDKHLWLNASYALASRVTEAFKTYGWCTRIRGVESGGTVEGLPTAAFPTDEGGVDIKCPTEIAISDRREAELSTAGFMALIHRKNSDKATFIGSQTVHQPAKYVDPAATANANLAGRLPYIFASSRFAHYLKCIVRDWIGSNREGPQIERDLTSWIMLYVDGQPDSSTEETKARKPLKDAKIEVFADEENPGAYKAKFMFMPHYQMEKMEIALSMVSRLPGTRG